MSFREFHRSLNKAVSSKEAETVRKIINKNLNLPLNDPNRCTGVNSSRFLESTLQFCTNTESKEIGEVFVSFLKKYFFDKSSSSKTKIYNFFDRRLLEAVEMGNIKLAELLLKNARVKFIYLFKVTSIFIK